ncbi:MAG: hypothetical protein ACT4O3_00165, partial [Elusimicrobiota bacterium]
SKCSSLTILPSLLSFIQGDMLEKISRAISRAAAHPPPASLDSPDCRKRVRPIRISHIYTLSISSRREVDFRKH